MQNIFNINKHIEKWDDYENLYKLIGDGNLTDEDIEWYKFRAAMWPELTSAVTTGLSSTKSVAVAASSITTEV